MSEQLQRNMQGSTVAHADDEIHVLDMLIVLARHKKIVIGTPIVIGALAIALSLMMTPIFTSTAKIMPPQQQQSSGVAAMLGQLGSLGNAASGIAGLKNPNDLYVGLLESRTVSDNLIAKFKLMDRYKKKTMDDTRAALKNVTDVDNGKKDGLISIKVNDVSPQFAADLANGYVEELVKLTQTTALTESSQRRLFFEKQLNEVKNQLASAEIAMRETQEKTGMILPDGQVQAIIASVAQLKGLITAKEVQLNAMRIFATGKNPDFLRGQEELRGLQAQLAKLGGQQQGKATDFMVATEKLPAVGVEYARSLRDVKYYEAIFELLAKQFELAKIDEAKESSLIQTLDTAVPADRKTAPKRAIIVLASVFGGVMLGILLAFIREAYERSRQNTESNNRWKQLFNTLRGSGRHSIQ